MHVLTTALSEPLDAQAAFTIFSRLVQQLPPSGAAQQRGTDEAVQQALHEYEAMLRQIRSQVVTEKADYEVKLAQRDRVIAGLRVRLQVSVVICLLIAAEIAEQRQKAHAALKDSPWTQRLASPDSPALTRQPWALLLSILSERIARTVTAGAALEAQGGARAAACHTEGARA
jgi:hypothetical protein